MYVLTPHRRGAGYFLDNQALGARERKEGDVQQCSHCDRVLIMQDWKEDGGWCGRCQHPICVWCADRMMTHGCEPAIKAIEAAFDMNVKLAHFRKLAGLDPVPEPRALIIEGK